MLAASASSGQMAGLCVPRRSPIPPLLARRGRLLPRRPAALLPRARDPALRPAAHGTPRLREAEMARSQYRLALGIGRLFAVTRSPRYTTKSESSRDKQS